MKRLYLKSARKLLHQNILGNQTKDLLFIISDSHLDSPNRWTHPNFPNELPDFLCCWTLVLRMSSDDATIWLSIQGIASLLILIHFLHLVHQHFVFFFTVFNHLLKRGSKFKENRSQCMFFVHSAFLLCAAQFLESFCASVRGGFGHRTMWVLCTRQVAAVAVVSVCYGWP